MGRHVVEGEAPLIETHAVRYATTLVTVAVLLMLPGCGGTADDSASRAPANRAAADSATTVDSATAADSVTVVFTKDEAPAPVRRPIPVATPPTPPLRVALEWLVRGPTAEERAAGVQSWFSVETASVLRSVAVDSAGHAVVDFSDLRPLIPNASTSFGSTMLLQELNGTVFQFPQIRSVEYRMEGSCDLFWNWLQYGCRIVTPAESP
jgi:hypothetical protein